MAKKKIIKKKTVKKKVTKKVAKKVAKKVVKKKVSKKSTKMKITKQDRKKPVINDDKLLLKNLEYSLMELVKSTSATLPEDIQKVILEALKKEEKNTSAEYALGIIKANIELATKKVQPICQDTGTIHIFVYHPPGYIQSIFTKMIKKVIVKATKLGYLRQNSVDSLTGINDSWNLGPGHPDIHFIEHKKKTLEVKLMLKGGGCENVGAQYALPNTALEAGRDLDGAKRVILDAIIQAQGKGCGPGVLGVCIGGDRGSGYSFSKKQLLRKLDDSNPNVELAKLEKDIVEMANKLGIGPMGFGGKTTLLGCKIGVLNRLPASYFVSISYMCWAYRRQGILLKNNNEISKWLY